MKMQKIAIFIKRSLKINILKVKHIVKFIVEIIAVIQVRDAEAEVLHRGTAHSI